MAFLNRIILLVFSILIFGCGEEKINTSIDSDSVDRIVGKMNPEEGLKFLADAELITRLRGNPHAINGYTVTQVREEAAIGRRYVAEKNREFLAPLIKTLLLNASDSARFMQNSVGIYISPREGYRSKSYSLAEIRSFYQSNGGDLAELEASVQSALED